MAIDTKDIYVQLQLVAIKDGSVWSGPHNICSPRQSKESYTQMEKDLMEVMIKWGAMSVSPEGMPPHPSSAKPAR